MVLPLGARFIAPIVYNQIVRSAGYGVYASRVRKAQRSVAKLVGGVASSAAAVGGGSYYLSKKGSSVTNKMMTPVYKAGGKKRTYADMGTMTNATYSTAGAPVQDKGQGYQQIVRRSAYYGKKLNKDEKKLKILGAKLQTTIERFNRVNATASGNGVFGLNYYHNTGSEEDAILPLYMMDLTCVNNDVRDSGGIVATRRPCPLLRLAKDTGTGPFYTIPVAGRDFDNTADRYTWQIERGLTNTYDAAAIYDSDFIGSVDVKMLLYGAKIRPSRISVELWQFTDEDMVPSCRHLPLLTEDPGDIEVAEAEPNALSDDEILNKWNNMWLSVTDKQIGNPITTRGLKMDKSFDVLYRQEYDFQPIDQQEADQTGHQIELNFKYDMNKVCSYIRNPKTDQVATSELTDGNEWQINTVGKNSCFVAPRGRVFLVVRGYTMQNSFNTPGVFPSFDLIVRRKRTTLNATWA